MWVKVSRHLVYLKPHIFASANAKDKKKVENVFTTYLEDCREHREERQLTSTEP